MFLRVRVFLSAYGRASNLGFSAASVKNNLFRNNATVLIAFGTVSPVRENVSSVSSVIFLSFFFSSSREFR